MSTGEPRPGTLYGVGVGPGDPELLTLKAVRLIASADVIAFHAAKPGSSLARAAAAPHLRAGQLEEELRYPVTTGAADHPGGYDGAMADFYAAAAEKLAAHLTRGRDVVLLAEGDPTLFSSYMHMHRRLAPRFRCVIVPGVTSVAAAAAAAGTPMVEGDEVLAILSATQKPDDLARWLRTADAAVILKVSRNVGGVQDALREAGRLDDARFVRRASHPDETVARFADVSPDDVPYMAAVVVPGARASAPVAPAPAAPHATTGEVVVVGLGPAGASWLTPEARGELAQATDIVGYDTYVARVPHTPGQRRHASDNRVEQQRAEFALDLARAGKRVAVVSSGDPGVFAMATAVLEAKADGDWVDVQVRIVPGITAAQAVASRVGAPLGHDFAVLSLSDQLKSWDIVAARLDAAARADLVIALYNPASKTRTTSVADARAIVLRHRSPHTPVVVGRAVGSDDETVAVTTLGDLDPAQVDMRTLLIIGSSRTRQVGGAVFTPRHY